MNKLLVPPAPGQFWLPSRGADSLLVLESIDIEADLVIAYDAGLHTSVELSYLELLENYFQPQD